MRYLVLICILFFCTLQTFSQQDYFIYVQTDNSQAFYLRVRNNVYSSSATGYLILSKFGDSTNSVTIGFPKNIFPEQQFNVPAIHKDAGYVLKNFGDNGWGLVNLQTQEIIRSGTPEEKKKSELTGIKRNDAFSMLLSDAVNDTSVLYTVSKPPKPAPPPVLVADEQKNDATSLAKTDAPKKDSGSVVKISPEKKDSFAITQKLALAKKDADTITSTHLPDIKKTESIAKNTRIVSDSNAVVKNAKTKAPVHTAATKAAAKRDSILVARNTARHNKDSIIIISTTPSDIKKTDSIAKNTRAVSDSIAVTKNTKQKAPLHTIASKAAAKRDSILIAKNAARHNKDSIIFISTAPADIKKQDSVAKNSKAVSDSIAVVKNTKAKTSAPVTQTKTARRDSILAARNAARHNKDSIIFISNAPVPAAKKTDSIATAKSSSRHNKDTIIFTDNTHRAETKKSDSVLTAKNTSTHNKDTIIFSSGTRSSATKDQSATAKNKNRKDTIIMMNTGNPPHNPDVVKNVTLAKEKPTVANQPKDTAQIIKKGKTQAPEKKQDVTQDNKATVTTNKVPVKTDSIQSKPAAKKDTAETVVKTEPVQPAETKADTIVDAPVKRLRPWVNKVAELLTDTSYIAIFVDESNEKFDTIRISVPFKETEATYAKPQQPEVVPAETSVAKIIKDTSTNNAAPAVAKKDSIVTEKIAKDTPTTGIAKQTVLVPVKADTTSNNKPATDSIPVTVNRESSTVATATKKDSIVLLADSARIIKVTPAPVVNSDCKDVATDSDIDKLRIKMLVVNSDDDRIALAKKLFRQKCLLVKQIRALSELFSSDEGKYRWLDATYPYVSDSGNFSSLNDLLKDNYYLNRFRAMLHH